jgi:hypothetical protein
MGALWAWGALPGDDHLDHFDHLYNPLDEPRSFEKRKKRKRNEDQKWEDPIEVLNVIKVLTAQALLNPHHRPGRDAAGERKVEQRSVVRTLL